MNLLIFNALSWEQRKLSEVTTEFKSGEGIKADEIEENGTYPVYGGNGLRGYTERYNHDGEYALIGRQGALCGNMNYSVGKAYFTEHAVAVKANESNDTRFLYYLLDRMDLGRYSDQSAQPGLAVNKLVVLHTYVPRKQEQEAIGVYFKSLDNLITLHQSKAESWKNKKNQLSTIYWEQRKLSEVVTEIKRTDEKSDAPVMMITAENGFINQSERYSTNNAGQSLKKYILLEKGELAYNHGASKLRPYGSCFALTTEEKARIPFVYHCFSTETENSEFLSIVLNGKAVEKQLRRIVSSGARMDGLLNISFDEYTSIPVMLPRKDEQDRISEYFKNLDHLITLHQKKCHIRIFPFLIASGYFLGTA